VPVTVRKRLGGTLPLVGGHFPPRWLRPSHASRAASPDALVDLAEDEIADARRRAPGRPVILHATLATDDVAPSRATPTEAAAHATLARLGALLAFARREGVAVVGLGDVPEILAR
jgi:sugar phosphate isomerase/epimerase